MAQRYHDWLGFGIFLGSGKERGVGYCSGYIVFAAAALWQS